MFVCASERGYVHMYDCVCFLDLKGWWRVGGGGRGRRDLFE